MMLDAIKWSVICMANAEETINAKRSLEGDGQRSSKMWFAPSRSIHCGGGKAFENMATTYRTVHGHLPGGYLSSLCQPCYSYFSNCYKFTCTTTEYCRSINGYPPTCTRSENCQPASGNWSDYKTLLYYTYRVCVFCFSIVLRFIYMLVCCHIYFYRMQNIIHVYDIRYTSICWTFVYSWTIHGQSRLIKTLYVF